MGNKFTPGPWEVLDNMVYVAWEESEDGADAVCEVWDDRGAAEDQGQIEATARLIAAAPDLLEAAEYTLTRIDPFRHVTVTRKLGAAISKATQEPPE